jgi:hypothetical protein
MVLILTSFCKASKKNKKTKGQVIKSKSLKEAKMPLHRFVCSLLFGFALGFLVKGV